jgi:hypothetical protein
MGEEGERMGGFMDGLGWARSWFMDGEARTWRRRHAACSGETPKPAFPKRPLKAWIAVPAIAAPL